MERGGYLELANPTLIKRPFATGDSGTHTIPDTSTDAEVVSQTAGWGVDYSRADGYAPKRVDMNSVFNMLSGVLFYCQKGFIFEYDSTQDYYAGCIIRDGSDIYYCHTSVASGSTYHRPTLDTLNTYWKKFSLMFDNTPIGSVQAWAGDTTKTTIPSGWLLCDGRSLNTASYSELFAVIGYKYGGSGSQFSLPNLVQKFIEGTDGNSGSTIAAGLPNITGTTTAVQIDRQSGRHQATGAFYESGTFSGRTDGDNGWDTCSYDNFDASRSNDIYGKSSTVQPPAVYMRYIIKYKKG